MSTIHDLPTPSLVVDLDIVERNCRRMLDKAEDSGVVLRPHVKTHKTVEGALVQLGGTHGPITVSTLAEAEFYADAGFRDITYAVPISPGKLERSRKLQERIDALHLLVDHPEALAAVEQYSKANAIDLSVFLKVDCGYHRAGVDPESSTAIDLARRIFDAPRLRLAGLLTHAGHSYHATTREQILAIADQESGAVATLAGRLADLGIEPGILSVGSTPTAALTDRFDRADEVRPGNYIFFDAFQAAIGACTLDDCAATVLATVLSVYPERGEILIDAGALALSKDLGAAHLGEEPATYGVIVHEGVVREDLKLVSLSQEHGKIEAASGAGLDRVHVGQIVRIIMNHSCLTAAMYDRFHVVRGEVVVDQWRPVRGW